MKFVDDDDDDRANCSAVKTEQKCLFLKQQMLMLNILFLHAAPHTMLKTCQYCRFSRG